MAEPVTLLDIDEVKLCVEYSESAYGDTHDEAKDRAAHMIACVIQGGGPCQCGLVPDMVLRAADVAAVPARTKKERIYARLHSMTNWMRQEMGVPE